MASCVVGLHLMRRRSVTCFEKGRQPSGEDGKLLLRSQLLAHSCRSSEACAVAGRTGKPFRLSTLDPLIAQVLRPSHCAVRD